MLDIIVGISSADTYTTTTPSGEVAGCLRLLQRYQWCTQQQAADSCGIRTTVGCVWQNQWRSPRLRISASLTLRLHLLSFVYPCFSAFSLHLLFLLHTPQSLHPVCVSECACQASPSGLIYSTVGGTKV